MKFICRKVNKVSLFNKIIAWFARTFINVNIFYCTIEILKKEMNRRKRIIKNFKRLLKEETSRENFKRAFDTIDSWQREVDIMEDELKRK